MKQFTIRLATILLFALISGTYHVPVLISVLLFAVAYAGGCLIGAGIGKEIEDGKE